MDRKKTPPEYGESPYRRIPVSHVFGQLEAAADGLFANVTGSQFVSEPTRGREQPRRKGMDTYRSHDGCLPVKLRENSQFFEPEMGHKLGCRS
jgi:hypothetical protein